MRDRKKANEWQKEYRKRNKEKSKKYESSLARRYEKLLYSSKIRKMLISITFEQFLSLRKMPCNYCCGPLPPEGSGLDRIDSLKGYHIDNVAPCCRKCNQAKSNMTIEEFKSHIEAIYNHFIKKV